MAGPLAGGVLVTSALQRPHGSGRARGAGLPLRPPGPFCVAPISAGGLVTHV